MLAPNAFVRNRYLIVRQVGSGAAGAVYEALDVNGRAHVALKQVALAPGALSDAPRPEFEHMARELAALRHPALPAVLDCFAEQGADYLAMEFVPGDDLAVMLERSGAPFALTQVLRWADQLLDALGHMHGQGIVHRDVKPQNLKLTPRGQLMLLDIGVAHSLPPQSRPLGGQMVSSLQFVPPEQVQGGPVDGRADLYALAATLYYLLTGELPLLAGRRANALGREQPDPLRPPHELNPQIPGQVSTVLVRALALDPAWRYESAAAMRAALERARVAANVPTVTTTEQRPVVAAPAATPLPAPAAQAAVMPSTLPPTMPAAPATSAASPALPRRLLVPVGVGAALIVALLAVLLLRGGAGQPGAQQAVARTAVAPPTARPAAPTAVQVVLPVATRPAGPGLPTAASQPDPPSPARPTTVPTTAPVATQVVAQVSSVEPQALFAGAQPLQLVVRGANLGGVRDARLVAVGRPPIGATIAPGSADQIALQFAPPAEPLNGEVSFLLELDGVLLEGPEIMLRDFVERRTVQGVLAQYDYTNRVAGDGAGAFTRMRGEPNVASAPAGQLRNGDVVDVLRNDVDGWYQVRVSASADAAQVGAAGWIERWLVDNQAAPTPVPAPQRSVFVGRVYSAPTDAAVQCGTSFESSIYGGVENGAGRGIAGARVRITSADGRNSFTVTTARGGIFSVPGLGCTSWTVSLLSVPNTPGGIQANRVVVRNLNGGRYTSAEVRFKLQG